MSDKLRAAVRELLHDLRWCLNQITIGRPPDPGDIEYIRTTCDRIEGECLAPENDAPPGQGDGAEG